MASLPRPLIALLVAVAAFFAVWTFALKPSSSSSSASAPVTTSLPAAHPAAHPAAKATAKTAPAHVAAKSAVVHHAATPLATLTAALATHKVVALLFYNPAGADDRADRQALNAISSHRGQVVKLAVPVAQVARFGTITNHVPVTTSPTLVVIDRQHQASTLVGFADPLEFSQLVASALDAK
jgi:hypothetical protein